MDAYTIVVPPEDRELILVEEDFTIEVPDEFRELEVYRAPGQ